MRRYEIYADNGHDGFTFEYYSNHRAGSKANIEDARKEFERKYGLKNARCHEFVKRTCFLLGD